MTNFLSIFQEDRAGNILMCTPSGRRHILNCSHNILDKHQTFYTYVLKANLTGCGKEIKNMIENKVIDYDEFVIKYLLP